MHCAACKTTNAIDRAHLKTRASGAGWEAHEFIYLCRICHIRSHQLGWKRFCDLFPNVAHEIKIRGWFFQNNFGVWKLRRKDDFIETKSQTP